MKARDIQHLLRARNIASESVRQAQAKVARLRDEWERRAELMRSYLNDLTNPLPLFEIAAKVERRILALCENCNKSRVVGGIDDAAIRKTFEADGWLVMDSQSRESWLPADLAWKFYCPGCASRFVPRTNDRDEWLD